MKFLREYIRILLTEAAKGAPDLPDNVSVVIADRGFRGFRIFYAVEDPLNPGEWIRARRSDVGISGVVMISKPLRAYGECGGA